MNKFLLTLASVVVASAANAYLISGTAILNPDANDGSTTLPGGNLSFLVIDTAADGFDTGLTLSLGQDLSELAFIGDDDLIIGRSATFFASEFFATVPGNANFNLGTNGISDGDQFGIVFFDNLSSTESITSAGNNYGFYTDSDWILGANNAASFDFGAADADTYQQLTGLSANQTVIPEPSTYALVFAGLALMGAVARRRK